MKTKSGHHLAEFLIVLTSLAAVGHARAQDTLPAKESWADSVAVSGDLRLRYEMIRADQAIDRDRARYRARVGITADLTPTVRAFMGLASGGDDPVSRNQSFGDGFTTKSFGIDLAYLDWAFHDDWLLTAGKMKKPWFRAGGTQLIWDSDLNPEGLAVAYDDKKFFASAGSFLVVERANAAETRLNTLQAGINLPVANDSGLTVAVSYFDYTNTIGQAPFYDDNPQGNTVDANGNYVFGYSEVEVGAEYRIKVRDWPVTLYGDYVVNTEASREDTGNTFGVIVGKAKAPRSMQFGYAWRDTGADAINATYNDSDFSAGFTDATGHYLSARYVLRENIYLNGTFMFSKVGGFAGNERDYDRIMLDIQFEF